MLGLQFRGPGADPTDMASTTTRATPERLYRLLADNATDVVTLHDLSGRYLYVSPSMKAFGGYAPEDLIGIACWKLMHPDDVASVQQQIAASLTQDSVVSARYRMRHAEGQWEWVETTARAVGAEIQCSTRKITELYRRLEQQSAVARIGNLVMERPELDLVFDDTVHAVKAALGIELVHITEHLGEGRARVRAGDGDGAIVEAIVGMARVLGMGVIPEGVETEGQLERLSALGCDHAQGFLLSRPLPAEILEELLRGGD
jgi:PAS domain S-box-containing protein